MNTFWLSLHLLSDATFGRGDGVAGLVDAEVQHDPYGLPYLSGKTLKGLLGAECSEVLDALKRQDCPRLAEFEKAAARLFGQPGSRLKDSGLMFVGDARLPGALLAALEREFLALPAAKRGLRQRDNLEAFTALRRQTAMDAVTGAPLENTLRTMRVIVREAAFEAELKVDYPIHADEHRLDRGLLAACVKGFRRAGTGRNRGRGKLRAEILAASDGAALTADWFALFQEAI